MNRTAFAVRPFRDGDESAIVRVFYESVHGLGPRVFQAAQVTAWAPDVPDAAGWHDRLATHETLVAERDGAIVGFAEFDRNGSLEYLYREPGSPGAGGALLDAVEARARELGCKRLSTEASPLLKPVLERRGWNIDAPEDVERDGVTLRRYRMSTALK